MWEIKTRSAQTWWWSSEGVLMYPLAGYLIVPLRAIGITPNMITIFNIGVGAGASYFLAKRDFALSWVLLFLHQLFDAMDGSMARKYNMCSELGAKLDEYTDICFGVFLATGAMVCCWPNMLIAAAVIAISFFMYFGELSYVNAQKREPPPRYVEELGFFELVGLWGIENMTYNMWTIALLLYWNAQQEGLSTEYTSEFVTNETMQATTVFGVVVTLVLGVGMKSRENAKAPPARTADQATTLQLRLLNLNVFLMVPLVYGFGTKKDLRLEQLISEHGKDADVLCLQEVWGTYSRRASRLVVAAREAGFEYHARCPLPRLLDGKALDGGLMVLSRYPITASDWHLYSASAHEDQLAAKGALYVKLEVGTRAVHLFDTHMQAFYNLDDRPATAAKSIQVEELAKFVLEKTSGDTEPVVMAGDFNINSHLAGAGDGSEIAEYEALKASLKEGGLTGVVDIVASEHDSGKVPMSITVVYDKAGKEVLSPHIVVDEKQMQQKEWYAPHSLANAFLANALQVQMERLGRCRSSRDWCTDHLFLWERGGRAEDRVAIDDVDVRALRPADDVGWEGLSQGNDAELCKSPLGRE